MLCYSYNFQNPSIFVCTMPCQDVEKKQRAGEKWQGKDKHVVEGVGGSYPYLSPHNQILYVLVDLSKWVHDLYLSFELCDFHVQHFNSTSLSLFSHRLTHTPNHSHVLMYLRCGQERQTSLLSCY